MTRHGLEIRHDPFAHERLAAGDAQFFDTEPDESRGQPVQLFERQQFFLRQKGHVLCHAIDAAEIAPIGNRYPQIGDGPCKRINQRGRFLGNVRVAGRIHGLAPPLDRLGPVRAGHKRREWDIAAHAPDN